MVREQGGKGKLRECDPKATIRRGSSDEEMEASGREVERRRWE